MSFDIEQARELVKERARAILADLATATTERTIPGMNVDTATMMESVRAVPPNSPGEPSRIYWPRDSYGRRVKRVLAPVEPTGDMDSAVVVPVTYAWEQERANSALGPAADQMQGELPAIVARHQL